MTIILSAMFVSFITWLGFEAKCGYDAAQTRVEVTEEWPVDGPQMTLEELEADHISFCQMLERMEVSQ